MCPGCAIAAFTGAASQLTRLEIVLLKVLARGAGSSRMNRRALGITSRRYAHKSKSCMRLQLPLGGPYFPMPLTPWCQSPPNPLPFSVRLPLIKRPNSPSMSSIRRSKRRKKTRNMRRRKPSGGERRASRPKSLPSSSKRGRGTSDYPIMKPHAMVTWHQLCLTGTRDL